MHIECEYCGRSHENDKISPPNFGSGTSHGICARCNLIFCELPKIVNSGDLEKNKKNLVEIIRSVLKQEINQKWKVVKGETYKSLLIENWGNIKKLLTNSDVLSSENMRLRGDGLVERLIEKAIDDSDSDRLGLKKANQEYIARVFSFLNELKSEAKPTELKEEDQEIVLELTKEMMVVPITETAPPEEDKESIVELTDVVPEPKKKNLIRKCGICGREQESTKTVAEGELFVTHGLCDRCALVCYYLPDYKEDAKKASAEISEMALKIVRDEKNNLWKFPSDPQVVLVESDNVLEAEKEFLHSSAIKKGVGEKEFEDDWKVLEKNYSTILSEARLKTGEQVSPDKR